MMKREIEEYILQHITPERELLSELYRYTHTSVINPNMVSGHIQGLILGMLVSMIRPERVLEIGTYTGYSAIAIASHLGDNGILDTIELNDELHDISSDFIRRSGFGHAIRQHTGDALKIIPALAGSYDLVFIDGDKREYLSYYRCVKPFVRRGGYIIADNVLWDGKVADPTDKDSMTAGIREFNDAIANEKDIENVIVPVRDGLMIIRLL